MNRSKALPLALLVSALVFSSCSGPKTACTTNCVQNGNALLSVSISDAPAANTAIMSFTLPILGLTLTPSGGGSPVPVFSSNAAANFELTRLQSDSDLIATNVSVVAGTYTAVNVTVAAQSAVLFNGSGAAIGSCAIGAACPISGNAGTITFSFASPLVLTANQKQWLDLDFNYNRAIVSTNTSVTIDVTQPNVLTAPTTPPTGVPSGDFANIDDFTGQVTAVSASSITIQSTLRGSLTAAITSSTIPVNDPQSQCTGGGALSCINPGSIVSLQGVLTNTGAINATELDIIDAVTTPADEAEGTLYINANCNLRVGMILSDSSIASGSSSPLKSAPFGQNVCLTLGSNATFAIDDGTLTNQGVPTAGFSSTTDLVAGQTVRAKISSAVSGTNVINATVSALILRFSRLTATISSVTSPSFTIGNLPAYFGSITTPGVQTYTNATIFEGVPGGNIGGLPSAGPVSISALLLNPGTSSQPFQAAKVRVP
jgi:uncharacterized protein DUF4382